MKQHKYVITTTDEAATEHWAAQLGANLRGGELIELSSDLGGGKTTFTRGLVRGAGSLDNVASPTFTISRVYSAPKFSIQHFDFYRLAEAGLATYELQDLLEDPKIVVVVEWANVVEEVLPADRLTITITTQNETTRTLEVNLPENLIYLIEGLC